MLAVAGVASLWPTWGSPRTVDGVALELGRVTKTIVRPDNVRWEPSRGALSDFLFGRPVLFVARTDADAPGDIYRAFVRISPTGEPLAVNGIYNLTHTPLGDDSALVMHGHRAAFATWTSDEVSSITWLCLDGEGTQNQSNSWVEKVTTSITNWQRTGSLSGIARYDVTFEPVHPSDVRLSMGPKVLSVSVRTNARTTPVAIDVEYATSSDPLAIQASAHVPKRLSHWAVDTVREVSWIGPEPVAWLEETVFGARDRVKRAVFARTAEATVSSAEQKAPVLDTSEASVDAAHWPPANVTAIWKTPEPGEGVWEVPGQSSWIRKNPSLLDGAPSPFYQTYVRPDEQRPYAKVHLIAMDMRQLDLAMEAGSEDPQPLTGPNGPGRLPRDPQIFTRVVAAFNGAFKTEHGRYGMMVNRRLLLPPQPGAATVITTKDHRVGLGTWGGDKQVEGIKLVSSDSIVSMRQNLDALVDGGDLNPTKRNQWGFSAPGKGMQTERSGLCVTAAHHLIYAWGDDVSADTLGKAQQLAGCEFGMHLDMNPFHTGFLFMNIEEFKGKKYKSELLAAGMEIPKDRYIEWAPKDFFYLTLHQVAPPDVEGALEWTPDPGTQPPPAWMPGFWRTRVSYSLGSTDVVRVDPGRVRWTLRGGVRDTRAQQTSLTTEDARRAVLSAGLGTGKLAFEPVIAGATPSLRGEDTAWLVLTDGGLDVRVPTASLSDARSAAELPLLFVGDDVRSYRTKNHEDPVVALGIANDGAVFLALFSDSALGVVTALRRAGCVRAVILDRGHAATGRLSRAGTREGIRAHYDDGSLVAIATPLIPRAFRFEPERPYVPPTKNRSKSQ